MSILCENGRTQRFRILRVITETWRWTMHFRASCSYLHSNHANHRYEWRWTKFWSAVNIRIHMRCSPKLERTRLQNRPEILKNPGSDFQHLCLFPSAEHRKNGYLLGRWRKTSDTLCFPNKSQPRSSTKIGLSLLSRHNGGSSGDAVMSSAVTRMLVSKLCSDRVNGISNRFGNAAKKITNGA